MAVAPNKRSVMTLFSSPTDIFSHQVRIVLAEKGVSVQIEYVEPGQQHKDLIDLNPYHSVPTLVDRDLTLYDPHIIMEYLDERFPHPPLMPVYPVARGTSRQLMYRIKNDWYSLMDKIEKGTAQEAANARRQLSEELIAVSPVFAEMDFFMSEEFSIVDCYLAPLLWRLPVLGIEINPSISKYLHFYMDRVFDRDGFSASLTDAEKEMRESRQPIRRG
ncbi:MULTISPECIES: stringent starvation protein SspA [Providencia]|uniref:Stringent starvation protein SspA n=2 Tax=Providencia TaxID=586 RepID=A0AA42JTT8_9GAMM|nr:MULTISPECIES: stringent starvation protein SspA [Providencia]HCI97271.1 stringent starvation protein A [Providencia sp.]APC13382.1 Stringent starvation protein A [Providencia rettgeri]AVL72753.1 stringent starvation protein A [Providencia rettgeri]EIL1981390.1 stringent starvation protein A [Providencia rettgeri]EIU7555678.1 stringent starvation protein A [Providencia rettgeri]